MSTSPGLKVRRQVPRLSLSRAEAAEALGLSLRSFEEHVQGSLRLVYVGRRRLVPMSELERFLETQARRPVGGDQ